MIGGSSTGNAGDTRTQRNPSTASPFGDFKTMQPPQPSDFLHRQQPFDGQPATPSMAPVDSVMTAGQRELMEARQLADQKRAQYAADAAMGNAVNRLGGIPYGQPSRIEMPYGISKPLHGMAVPMHTHGENGEIQMGGIQGGVSEGRPYRGPMPDLQTVASTLDFMK